MRRTSRRPAGEAALVPSFPAGPRKLSLHPCCNEGGAPVFGDLLGNMRSVVQRSGVSHLSIAPRHVPF